MTTPLRCVIDASVCIKHFIPDLLTPKVDQLLAHLTSSETEIFIPDLFYIECANTLWKYVRAKLYPADKVQVDLATLKTFPLRVVSTADLMAEAVNIGLSQGISAYDGSYVALSVQMKATLLTLDQRLVKALEGTYYDVRSLQDFSIPSLP